ncbi:MAG TPA: hypothetical protein DCR40_00375 [Prolixibacteraceae bacterium]|nr:hypothetical protein [Prolixibacteraceae bacterium]
MRNKTYIYLIIILLDTLVPSQKLTGKNKYTVKIIQPDPIQAPVISSVTVSPENKNLVVWEQHANENIQYFKIYRDAANPDDGWINVGKAMYPGNYSFIDPSSYPNVRSYQYRISTVDKCGNEIFNTQIHKTIRLTVDKISDATYLLKWNPYEGFDIAGYKIYRGTDVANLSPIDTITALATGYTDIKNPYKDAFYQVEAISKQDTITIQKKLSLNRGRTRSNIASNKSVLTSSDTADTSKIQVYPNPLTINAVVVFPYDASQTYQLSILDLTGHTIYMKQVFSGEIEIERKNLKEGLYIIQVAGKKTYRKKLMVGSYKAWKQ